MHLMCARCSRVLEYSGERPLFCGFCGQPILKDSQATAAYVPSTRLPVPDTSTSTNTGAQVAHSIPQMVGRYRLIKELGSGGMGTVYEAEDSASGRRVAVKLIAADFAASRDTVERFRQEGRLASAIAHPRCVFVLAADEEAGRPYIVMELMPGSTLKDLVEKEGPLPVARAVALILDVIDGLQEAHHSGVIHRDVKPSNCFLEADGRVKIGDFGLSKSLSSDSHLTRTGTFLGTPLFASPEQVRGEAVDNQTDVYSVAATLYFLLTGKAPFQSPDAAITLARLVSDPPPPMRSVRRDLPAALDRVVLRGLERQRERRPRTLEAFRAALLPFVPSRLSIGGMGIRAAAYGLDYLVLMPVTALVIYLAFTMTGTVYVIGAATSLGHMLTLFGQLACSVGYFALLEGMWGCSLGKRFLRLRVCRLHGPEPPGLPRAFWRALIWYACLNGPYLVLTFVYDPFDRAARPALGMLTPIAYIVGVLLVLCSMRQRNGYRGPHELMSGTRVIGLPWAAKPRGFYARAFDRSLIQAPGVPAQVGPFVVQGALCWSEASRVLLAEDKTLDRKVWLWLRPTSLPPLPAARRELARSTRLRWLTCGRLENWQWDAFLAPPGALVGDLAQQGGRLNWADARHLLEQLIEELAAAATDETQPASLVANQVWVGPSGRLQLLDMPLNSAEGGGQRAEVRGQTSEVGGQNTSDFRPPTSDSRPPAAPEQDARVTSAPTDQSPALALLAQVATLLLEGRSRPAGARPRPVRAPVPRHAEACLKRLLGIEEPYRGVKQFQADLAATHDRPAEVSRSRRFAHLGILAFLMFLGVGVYLAAFFMSPGNVLASNLAMQIQSGEHARATLQAGAARDLAAGLLNPAAPVRLAAAGQWHSDMILESRLSGELAAWRTELGARLQALGWAGKLVVDMSRGDPARNPFGLFAGSWRGFRGQAQSVLDADAQRRGQGAAMIAMVTMAPLITLIMWPALWVLWALATRGGFSYGVAGIALVRSDGRRPSHLRCAWRSLLFWAPLTGLLVLSILLDAWFWREWEAAGGANLSPWLVWLSSAAWGAAVLLLPIYAGLALLCPARSLHDRIAGTCLVPR